MQERSLLRFRIHSIVFINGLFIFSLGQLIKPFSCVSYVIYNIMYDRVIPILSVNM